MTVLAEALPTEFQWPLADIHKREMGGTRHQHVCPTARPGADLKCRHSGRYPAQEHVVDQRLLPLGRCVPLLALLTPVIS